ncbi:hypothetical protein T492DRAFT_397893 [Pavlovales sp. CCMP2436]|nr:hypothetical protein T492DRAFT_397893 [Pavlovales sp. CCMP2436]
MSGANEAGALAYQKMRDDPESCVEAGLLPGYSKPRAEDCKSGGAEIGGLAESAADAALVAYAAEPAALGRTGAFHVDWWRYYTKAFASNACTFAIMLVGIAMKAAGIVTGTRWVLAAGVFGFAGGITNWIAVHMLFEKVPGLYGSGVIPMRFKEIRETVKDTMMRYQGGGGICVLGEWSWTCPGDRLRGQTS